MSDEDPYGDKAWIKAGHPKRPATGAFAKGSKWNKPPIAHGSEGPSGGTGYGGAAKGAGAGPEALIPGTSPEKQALSAAKVRDRKERVAHLEDALFDIATGAAGDAENPIRHDTRIMAATRLHAIYEGQPVQKSITAAVDDVSRLGDGELHAELARLSRAATDDPEGAPPAGVPGQPSGLV